MVRRILSRYERHGRVDAGWPMAIFEADGRMYDVYVLHLLHVQLCIITISHKCLLMDSQREAIKARIGRGDQIARDHQSIINCLDFPMSATLY